VCVLMRDKCRVQTCSSICFAGITCTVSAILIIATPLLFSLMFTNLTRSTEENAFLLEHVTRCNITDQRDFKVFYQCIDEPAYYGQAKCSLECKETFKKGDNVTCWLTKDHSLTLWLNLNPLNAITALFCIGSMFLVIACIIHVHSFVCTPNIHGRRRCRHCSFVCSVTLEAIHKCCTYTRGPDDCVICKEETYNQVNVPCCSKPFCAVCIHRWIDEQDNVDRIPRCPNCRRVITRHMIEHGYEDTEMEEW
jgi:hypothetical protein